MAGGHGGHGGGGAALFSPFGGGPRETASGPGGFALAPEDLEEMGLDPNDPEVQSLIEGLSGLVGADDERQMIGHDAALAEQMRGAAMPEMRQVGRVAVAANPLEFLGAAGMRWQGAQKADDAMARSQGLLDKERSTTGSLLQRYLRQRKPAVEASDPVDPFAPEEI